MALQSPNKKVVVGLEVNGEVLDNINDEFKTTAHSRGLKIHSFQEARGISGFKGVDGKVSWEYPKYCLRLLTIVS
jgi:hypothetical protein